MFPAGLQCFGEFEGKTNVAPNEKKLYIIGMKIKAACFFLGVAFLSLGVFPQRVFSQEGESGAMLPTARTIPDALRRPQRGELPRYPQDVVIGELGRGEAPEAAYRFARSLLVALTAGNYASPVFSGSPPALIERHITEIRGIEPQGYRIGGGRTEMDGYVSFLVRFLGREESITGELFINQEYDTARWFLDDLILEERRSLTEIRDSHRFIFSPYERFF